MVEVMKIMVTSCKRSHACTATLSAPNPAAGHHAHQRLLDTPGQIWVSLLWGHCTFLLGPGAHQVLFVPSKSLFPQSCVSSGGSMVGLMVTSSKRAYAIPRSTAPRAPAPTAVHCWPYLLRRHPNTVLSQSLRGLCILVHTRFVWTLWTSLAGTGFDSKYNFTPPTVLLCFSFALERGVAPHSRSSPMWLLLQHHWV